MKRIVRFPTHRLSKPALPRKLTPADSARDHPDVSLFASDGYNRSFYVVCASDQNVDGASCNLTTSPTSGTINFTGVGGTSGGTPAFAGIMALSINRGDAAESNTAPRKCELCTVHLSAKNEATQLQGYPAAPAPPATLQFSRLQYRPSASTTTSIKHLIPTESNGTTPSLARLGSPDCTGASGGNFGIHRYQTPMEIVAYEANTGYDLATGLGSINASNLISKWTTANLTATTTTLGTPSTTSLTSGQTFTVPVTVTGGGTGSVSLSALRL